MASHCKVCEKIIRWTKKHPAKNGYCQSCDGLYCQEHLPTDQCCYCNTRLCEECTRIQCGNCLNFVCEKCPSNKCDTCNLQFCGDCVTEYKLDKYMCKKCPLFTYECCKRLDSVDPVYQVCATCNKACCVSCGSSCKYSSCGKFICKTCVNHECICSHELHDNPEYNICSTCSKCFCDTCISLCASCLKQLTCRECGRQRCEGCNEIICKTCTRILDKVYCQKCLLKCYACQKLHFKPTVTQCRKPKCTALYCTDCVNKKYGGAQCSQCNYVFCPKHSIIERVHMEVLCGNCWDGKI